MNINATQERVDELNRILKEKALQIRKAIDEYRFEDAKNILLNEALVLVPNHPVMLEDMGFLENKLKNYEKAYEYSIEALKNSQDEVNVSLYDNLASICYELKRFEEMRYYGRLSIKTKKEESQKKCKVIYSIPKGKTPGLSNDKSKNIISYSLFGSDSKYCETAVSTTELAKKIYPEWTCRFYVDESVPKNVVERLRKKGAQIIYVNEEEKKISGLFWRFFVVNDPEVQCYIIRDADSLLSYKEKAAVDEWINSDKWFHVMRDANIHTELILAGMWGGYTGVFKNIRETSQKFFDELEMKTKMMDQTYLREIVWPTVSQSVLVHDNRMLDDDSKVFPDYEISEIEQIPYFHVGMVDAGAQSTTVYIDGPVGDIVTWYLVNENRDVICYYNGKVEQNDKNENILRVNLPYFYSKKVKEKKWEVLINKTPLDEKDMY